MKKNVLFEEVTILNSESSNFPKSYWREQKLPSFKTLSHDLHVDVAIIGAGITGITAAYLLSKEGKKVAVLETGSILDGTTGHTTAKITSQHNLIYDELISHIGKEKAKGYFESNEKALHFIRSTIEEKNIDCDFSDQDAFIYATTEKSAEKIKREYVAYQKLGIPGELHSSIPFDISIKNALSMKGQAQFHPLKYMAVLVEEAMASGCLFYENTTAEDVENPDDPTVMTKSGHKIKCSHVISASHFPFYDGMGFYFARMSAERSYVIGVKSDKPYPGGMYISADTPSRSIRHTPYEEGYLLLIGGENHKTGQGIDTMKHYEALSSFANDVFGSGDYRYRWSAQDLVTLDNIPYIGPITSHKEKILVATGFKKWGMTTGTLAAQMLTDHILKKENPYTELYAPSRFNADPSLKKLLKENADVAVHLVKGKLKFVPKDTADVGIEEGSVVMFNGKRAGAYKDKNGELFLVDTTCTHLGCECEWNHAEKTWDCPCHGSRFSYCGDVVEGPATKPLKKLE